MNGEERIEEIRRELKEKAMEVAGSSYDDLCHKRLLHDVFGTAKPSREAALIDLLSRAVKERDRRMFEWIGRNMPSEGAPEPKSSINHRIAECFHACLEDGLGEGKWFLPRRSEVAEILGVDIKRVSEFYKQLAARTKISLDERETGHPNAWWLIESSGREI